MEAILFLTQQQRQAAAAAVHTTETDLREVLGAVEDETTAHPLAVPERQAKEMRVVVLAGQLTHLVAVVVARGK